jgi:SAM-dependent methyltransferase
MPKQGEIDYIDNIGPDGARHALNKPWSDAFCGGYLIDVGILLSVLPPPPARLLDVGAGTGWTSVFFAQRGYEVVGLDLAPAMIELANQNKQRAGLANLRFLVGDYEALADETAFDVVVFFDSLHHAVDEQAAIRGAYRVLKPGGVCATLEPGVGHAAGPQSHRAMELYDVTERDMPPSLIIRAGQAAGFQRFQVYERATNPQIRYDSTQSWQFWYERFRQCRGQVRAALRQFFYRQDNGNKLAILLSKSGLVVMQK